MIEGPPLHYHPSHLPPTVFIPPQFPFFQRFEPYAPNEMTEEFVAQSPHSPHSDSDNSLSSTEAPFSPIRPTAIRATDTSTIRCCWKNCGTTFASLDELANHVTKVHAASGPNGLFYCGWEGCLRNDRGFNARYKMLVHVRTHTNEKPHKCDKCEKSFSRAENLKIHSRSHSGEKPYVCPVPGCNKAYSNSSDRFKHTRTHQVEKPYKCKVAGCPKRYTDPSSLRKHVKTYKHFPTENNAKANETAAKIVEKVEENSRPKENGVAPPAGGYNEQMQVIHSQKCVQPCCVPEKISKAAEMFGLGALIEFREDVRSMSWNNYMESKGIYGSYPMKQDQMDVDVPLDLSISGKQFS